MGKILTKSWQELETEVLQRFKPNEYEDLIKESQKEWSEKLGSIPLSREAAIYDVAQKLEINMNKEEFEMELSFITGYIKNKSPARGKLPTSYQIDGAYFGTYDEEQSKFNKEDYVKVGYEVVTANSGKLYNNIKTIELAKPTEVDMSKNAEQNKLDLKPSAGLDKDTQIARAVALKASVDIVAKAFDGQNISKEDAIKVTLEVAEGLLPWLVQ